MDDPLGWRVRYNHLVPQPVALPADLRVDAARNRERVLAVARNQLAAGDLSLAMNVIARQAGVGVGTVYRHFPTRQVLLETLTRAGFEDLLIQVEAAADDPDPRLGLRRLLTASLRSLLDHPSLGVVLREPACACTETSDLSDAMGAALNRLLDRARRARAIRADVTADDLRRYVLGLEQAVRLGGGTAEQEERDIDVLLLGLQPSGRGY